MTKDQENQMRELAKECGLTKEDFFKHAHYVIITRQGIEKIIKCRTIAIKFEVVAAAENYAAVKCIAESLDLGAVETFGSADKQTSQNKYFLEMAEKRAMSRAVLKLTNLYEQGVFGEDEGVQHG